MTAFTIKLLAVSIVGSVGLTMTTPVIAQDQRPDRSSESEPEHRSPPKPPMVEEDYQDEFEFDFRPGPRPRQFEREPGSRDRRRPVRPPVLSEEQLQQRLNILRQIRPEIAERVERMRTTHPQRVREFMKRHWPRIERWLEMKKRDPETLALHVKNMRLDQESRQLARQLRSGQIKDPQKAEEARRAIRKLVEQHFQVRQEIRERKLAALEQRIAHLRRQVGNRSEKQAELKQRRFQQLVGESDDGSW